MAWRSQLKLTESRFHTRDLIQDDRHVLQIRRMPLGRYPLFGLCQRSDTTRNPLRRPYRDFRQESNALLLKVIDWRFVGRPSAQPPSAWSVPMDRAESPAAVDQMGGPGNGKRFRSMGRRPPRPAKHRCGCPVHRRVLGRMLGCSTQLPLRVACAAFAPGPDERRGPQSAAWCGPLGLGRSGRLGRGRRSPAQRGQAALLSQREATRRRRFRRRGALPLVDPSERLPPAVDDLATM